VFRIGTRRLATAKLSLLKAAVGMVCLGVCLAPFSLAQAPAGDSSQYAAKAISVSGQVSVLRDNQEWAVEVGGQVRAKELIFTGPDGQARFEVSDGSTFDVYPNSRVVFRKNVPNWRDLLDVLVGRVKIHIQHWGDQPNHNRVLTPTAVISVRGTTFDVSVDDDDETTLVEVEEGSVEVQHALLPSGNARTVNAGESLLIYRNVPIASGRFDKGEFFKRAARMAVDAISTWESRVPRVAGGSAGSTGPSVGSGDTKKPPPPPPPPAPPSAPSVNGGFTESGPAMTAPAQTPALTRWHRFAHLVMRTAMRLVFGESDEDQVRGVLKRRDF
jgi:hypothetical protein